MKKWRCTVCGYVHVGENPPDKCPVCGAGKAKFKLVEEQDVLYEATCPLWKSTKRWKYLTTVKTAC